MANEEMTSMLSGESDLTYRIIQSAPAFVRLVEELTVCGDTRDQGRGVLMQRYTALARFSYLPVQAILWEMHTAADFIVEIVKGRQVLTTLPFCTVWRGMQRDHNPERWERVSFPKFSQALLYNERRLRFCPACQHLHKNYCVLDDQQTDIGLPRALAFHGQAMCALGGYVYLVSVEKTRPGWGDPWSEEGASGTVYQYAIEPLLGLQVAARTPVAPLSTCAEYLISLGVPLDGGWQAVQACPAFSLDGTTP